jgi:asparagine synthetase B (glutamine-hydrolysing)
MERGDPLSGTGGFAGELESGTLVRDVLGRYPLFIDPDVRITYATDPTGLRDPDPVPPGHRRDGDGDTRVFRLPDPALLADDGRAVAAVGSAVETVEGDPPVAFSGGLDSGLLAAGTDGRPFVGGFPDSDDDAAARSAGRPARSSGRCPTSSSWTSWRSGPPASNRSPRCSATGSSGRHSGLPGGLLVDGGTRKVALRAAAADLPTAVRRRAKTAVQYGSDVARELDRLARRAGFKCRIDDHVRRYVDSLSA